MNNTENIVVGIDATTSSIEILKRAIQLSKEKKAKLMLIHVINQSWFKKLFPHVDTKEVKEKIESKLEDLLENERIEKSEYQIKIVEGNPADEIVKYAKELKSKLIIIGANSKEDFTTKLFGSTAHKVAQNGPCPLLIVKNSCQTEYKNILAFTDLSDISKESILFAKNFFDKTDIKLIHAYKQLTDFVISFYNASQDQYIARKQLKEEAKEDFDTFAKEVEITNKELLESYFNVTDILKEKAEGEKADLVVLGSAGVNNATSALHGSVAAYLMETLDCDILLFVE